MIVVELFDGLGGEVVEVLVRAFGVEPLHPFGGAQLDVVDVAPGAPCRRMSSFLNDPTVVSARALSRASPTDPTEGSTPSSRSRWVKATEVYWVDSSGRRNTSIRRCMDGMAKRVGECGDREAGDALAGPSSSGAT